MNEKVKGYIKDGETLFVSVKFPHLSLIIDAGGDVQIGDKVVNRKPRYADFTPGFAGGEFRANKATAKRAGLSAEDLLANLRERDAADDHYVEVRDVDHLAELVSIREQIVKDDGTHEVVSKGAVKAEPKAVEPAPAKSEAKAPVAAKGPGRRAVAV